MIRRMRRVLISQRVDSVEGRDEVRDGLDTRFAPILWEMGFAGIPLANFVPNPHSYVASFEADAAILSGGNDIGSTPDRDATETALLDWAAEAGIPVLAICRGLQVLNRYQGGRLERVSGHVATRHHVQGLLAPRGREVNSYHTQGISLSGLGHGLGAIACDDDGHVEAVMHRQLPWLGVMWHPERERTPDPEDLRLIRTHLLNPAALEIRLQNGAFI